MKKPSMPNQFQRRLIEDAKKVIGEINGEPVDNIDKVWRTLKTNVERPEVAKLVLQQYDAAMGVDHAWRESAVADLLAYEAHWGPIFEMRRKTKRPLPEQYPDPDDIVITSPTSFRFLGPVIEQEARDWEFFRDARSAFFMVAQEITDWSGDVFSIDEGRERWARVRRKFYRINRLLHVAFKKKYPAIFSPFEPSCDLTRGGGRNRHFASGWRDLILVFGPLAGQSSVLHTALKQLAGLEMRYLSTGAGTTDRAFGGVHSDSGVPERGQVFSSC